MRLARRTARAVERGSGAAAYHTAALPLAASGLLHPLAGAAMASSSVFVWRTAAATAAVPAGRPDWT